MKSEHYLKIYRDISKNTTKDTNDKSNAETRNTRRRKLTKFEGGPHEFFR
jgi:hypothetical protein